jgi:precorrin-6A/cobalt-precorrin-6A reductase
MSSSLIALEKSLAMPVKRILILGGTTDARVLAARLVELRQDVVSSLAGVTADPLLPVGRVRSGGFGGADGLAAYIIAEKIDVVIDATHPFAVQISASAVAAAAQTGLKLLRLERPEWKPEAGDDWREVADMNEAIAALPDHAKVFVSTGRKCLGSLFAREDLSGVIRAIEPLAEDVPARWTVQLERPPFSLQHETALLKQHAITHLLTKNAGGAVMATKLLAARQLHVPVVMIVRPVKPTSNCYSTVDAVVAAALQPTAN